MQYRLLFLLLLTSSSLFATHNRTGYIRYEQTGALTVRAEIITLTDNNAGPAERDTLTICWGDGQTDRIARVNGEGDILENGFKRNIYAGVHTYSELGEYIICLTDPNRNAGILNINPPNSEQIVFHIQTTVQLLDLAAVGANQSPLITHDPTDLAFVGQPYIYDPEVVDTDGDSLAFSFITPMQGVNDPVPGFSFPNELGNNNGSTFTLDEQMGVLTWDAPQFQGKYNIAILISSYRNGERVDAMVLDMEIRVLDEDVTDVEDIELAQAIQLYPNPNPGAWLQVNMLVADPNFSYIIYDTWGRSWQTGQLTTPTAQLLLQDLPAGQYYLSFFKAGRLLTTKSFSLIK